MQDLARRAPAAAIAVGLLILVLAGGTGVHAAGLLAQGSGPEELIDRLIDIERTLPDLPPEDVILFDEQTWAEFPGNYRGALVELDSLADQTRQLFIDASEADGEVATAVADVARAILVLRQGFELLAEWEEADLEFPLEAEDPDDVAAGADEAYGKAVAGFRLLLDANSRRQPGYSILSQAEAADPEEKAFFEVRLEVMEAFELQRRPELHRALSLPTTQVIRPIDRFETSAPGVEPRARTFQFVCVDREAYLSEGFGTPAELSEALAALGLTAPAPDCAEFENGNEARLISR